MKKVLFAAITALVLFGAITTMAKEATPCNKFMMNDDFPVPCAGKGGNCC